MYFLSFRYIHEEETSSVSWKYFQDMYHYLSKKYIYTLKIQSKSHTSLEKEYLKKSIMPQRGCIEWKKIHHKHYVYTYIQTTHIEQLTNDSNDCMLLSFSE